MRTAELSVLRFQISILCCRPRLLGTVERLPWKPNWLFWAAGRAATPPRFWPPIWACKSRSSRPIRSSGGTCLLRGCIPSKALLHVARVINETTRNGRLGHRLRPARRSTSTPSGHGKKKSSRTLTGGLKQLAKKRKVEVDHARGYFENSTTLRLDYADGKAERPTRPSSIACWPAARAGRFPARSSCRPIG